MLKIWPVILIFARIILSKVHACVCVKCRICSFIWHVIKTRHKTYRLIFFIQRQRGGKQNNGTEIAFKIQEKGKLVLCVVYVLLCVNSE